MIPAPLQEHLLSLIGEIMGEKPIGGGCIHNAVQLATPGGLFFLKWNTIDQGHNFETEEKGLKLLSDAGSLQVPSVLHHIQATSHAGLVLEWVEQKPKAKDYFVDFGEKLAQLHQVTKAQFGLPYDNYIGSLPQINIQHDYWADFFRECRLLPQLNMANAQRLLSAKTRKGFDVLFSKLDFLMPEEAPALLHGDLWGGNILRGPDGHAVIIDPAVYFGHREAEIAFMQMFDSYPAEFYDAYEAVRPLAPGWQERVDLFNLYPLLVHVNLFGGGYVGSVERTLKKYM